MDLIYDLLLPAEKYCLRHLDVGGGYKILADIYGGIGSLHTESNKFEEAYDSFLKEWKYLELAFQFGELEKPSIWEVYGYGRLANGLHGLNRYEEAEEYYQKSLKAWEGIPGDRTVYTTNLATCLWLQGKLGQAEALLHSVIKDRNDATNFRYVKVIRNRRRKLLTHVYFAQNWLRSSCPWKRPNRPSPGSHKRWQKRQSKCQIRRSGGVSHTGHDTLLAHSWSKASQNRGYLSQDRVALPP